MRIARNSVVTLDFTMYSEENEVLESSRDDTPLVYMQGIGELPEGLEDELEGKQAGDEVDVILLPGDAYGEYDASLVQSVPREQFEGIDDIAVGMRFEAETEEGPHVVHIVAVEDDRVIVDANEPYAGRTVRFEVKVLGVREASADEIEHGHVHGPECDH
jgi:FKBP-type peptidyl-prolyl cis-trans isomerase SlyD